MACKIITDITRSIFRKRKVLLFVIMLNVMFVRCSYGQFNSQDVPMIEKPQIDTAAFNNWSTVANPRISNNGKYFLYAINQVRSKNKTLIVKEVKGNWNRKWIGASQAIFSNDSREMYFIKSKDSLCVYSFISDSTIYISNVKSFKLFVDKQVEWLICQQSNKEKGLMIRNLQTGNVRIVRGVERFWLNNSSKAIIIKRHFNGDLSQQDSLFCLKTFDNQPVFIWSGNAVDDLVFNKEGNSLAFSAKEKTDSLVRTSFWYYDVDDNHAVLVANDQSIKTEWNLKLDGIHFFSLDNKRLFITLKERPFPKSEIKTIGLDIWSYNDTKLQSQQLLELLPDQIQNTYYASININDRSIVRLQNEDEEIRFFFNSTRDDIAVITKTNGGDKSEWNWNGASKPSFYIVSTITGIKKELPLSYPYTLSPGGKYLIGTDSHVELMSNNFISYELTSGKTCNITQSLSIPLNENEVFGASSLMHRDLRIVSWIENDQAAIISDKYDLWKIDPSGKKRPINLTNGIGRANKIVFRISGGQEIYGKLISGKGKYLLSAFDKKNKNQGFYRIDFAKSINPEMLTMSPYFYSEFFDITSPLKARDVDIYIIERQTATTSSNYFWTDDFKNFTELTDNHPEKNYNWLTSELIKFKTLDGRNEVGVLYKPENFDQRKKYPLLIHYYTKKSNYLHSFLLPGVTNDEINIPWFVSRGYLVFTPDIQYKLGETGLSAYNTIVAAAKYLSNFNWVDPKKIGIQGHSFGGFETNYIISHTDVFAAAMSSSGFCDLISAYGDITSSGSQFFRSWAEVGQGKIANTLWEKPDLYVTNSPIFKANKVTTPLLMMNNKKDGIVNFSQGVEFFTALRRLGKKVWMLQYDGGDHSLIPESKEAMDYNLRITQFFDHYLKDAFAPRWMLDGVPAKLKGIETGLELDTTGRTPGYGLILNNNENQNNKK